MNRDARSFEVRRFRDLSDREPLTRVLALVEDVFGEGGARLVMRREIARGGVPREDGR